MNAQAMEFRIADAFTDSLAQLRTAFALVDNEGYIFIPTALYLEAEPTDVAASNALRMQGEQVAQVRNAEP